MMRRPGGPPPQAKRRLVKSASRIAIAILALPAVGLAFQFAGHAHAGQAVAGRIGVWAATTVPTSVATASAGTPTPAGTPVPPLTYALAWKASLDGNADSSPVVLRSVRFPNGARRAVVYALTGNNTLNCSPIPADFAKTSTLYAFDATSGKPLWHQSTIGPSRCTTASPAAAGNWVYGPGFDGKVHKYDAAGGTEYRRGGWPIPYTLMPFTEKVSASLVISGRYLYVTTGGFAGDLGHYQGHLVTIDLKSGHVNIFNSLCSSLHVLLRPTPGASTYCPDRDSAMWGRGEAAIDPVNKDVYVVTGNGRWNGTTDWGDSLLRLSPDGSHLLDSFTPANQAFLDENDQDLGSTGPAMLPPVEVGGMTYHLAVQGGKGPAVPALSAPRALYLLNRDQLSGKPGPGHLGGQLQTINAPGKRKVLTAPAVWTDPQRQVWVFYANQGDITAYGLDSSGPSAPRLTVKWDIHRANANFTTPILSHGVLYIAQNGAVVAYDPASGKTLWSSAGPGSGGTIGNLHWEYPTASGQLLFMTDETAHLYAYRQARASSSGPAAPQPGAGGSLSSVTCTSPANCWAVGYQTNAKTGAFLNEVLHWNGSTWSLVSTPNPSGTASGRVNWLRAVTCTSSESCWAVGYYSTNSGNTYRNEALRWDGSTWSLAPVPNPAGTKEGEYNSLSSVTCATSSDCWAVGFYTQDAGNTFRSATLRWNGSTWSLVPAPNPAGTGGADLNYLSSVACTASTSCWAVGYGSNDRSRAYRSEALRWNGSKWSAVSALTPLGTHLNAIACASSSDCWAAGYRPDTAGGDLLNEALHRKGSTWSLVSTPSVVRAAYPENSVIEGVACTSAPSCWAVGYRSDTSTGHVLNEALRWNGSTWSLTPTPNPAGTAGGNGHALSGVACTSARNCWAVGTYHIKGGSTPQNELLHWNGSGWSAVGEFTISAPAAKALGPARRRL